MLPALNTNNNPTRITQRNRDSSPPTRLPLNPVRTLYRR